jgi:hypothetical protein
MLQTSSLLSPRSVLASAAAEASPGLIFEPLTRRLAHFNIGERQVVAVEQLGHLASCGERLVLVQPLLIVLARSA